MPNPAVAGTVSFDWPERIPPADAASFRYELQDLQGHTLKSGSYETGKTAVPNVATDLYLLVTTSPQGERQTRRVGVR